MEDHRFDRRTIIALAAVIGAGAFLLKDAPPVVASSMQPNHAISEQSASAMADYETARRTGSPIELCARAGAVAAAYRLEHDESTASTWKEIEDVHCNEARFWQDRVNAEALSSAPASTSLPARQAMR